MKTGAIGRIGTFRVAGLAALTLLASCMPESGDQSEYSSEQGNSNQLESAPLTGCNLNPGSHTLTLDEIAFDVVVPEGKKQGDILVLNAWNETQDQACSRTRFCHKASKKGYRVILPAMGKSIYAQTVYPETRADWKVYPTLKWLKEEFIPGLQQNHCMLSGQGQNFLVGFGMGARGAVLLAEEVPGLFAAVAALSGEYDPSQMPRDNIYKGFLGDFESNKSRWKHTENAMAGTENIRSALFLGHGKQDRNANYKQSQALYDQIKRHNPKLRMKLAIEEDREGDYGYWSSAVSQVLDFFEDSKASTPETAQ